VSLLPYYRHYSPFRAGLAFAIARLRARGGAAKLSWSNRIADYQRLQAHPGLLPLHYSLNADIAESARDWPHYDYGEGYFYQGCREIGISGLRDTEARFAAFELARRLAGKRVLDIGCNSGFLDAQIAPHAAHVTGLDANPHLIRMARKVAGHLGHANCSFLATSFEEAPLTPPYDAVLSFANHSTFDGLTRHTLEAYFARCAEMLSPGGLFLFESHAPAYEGEAVTEVIALLGQRFDMEEQAVLRYGTYLDTGRTFVSARRRGLAPPRRSEI
jgi:cyclopropane fatty-acyl-phospholipid synthase-like methyltransferase